jgi:membrane protein YqaA with SNARE-associated domain
MAVFQPLYQKALGWSRHRLAPAWLTFISFIEAIFFPVPPEVMLAPMTLAHPKSWFRYATLSLAGSSLGAFIGYALGLWAIHLVEPHLIEMGLGPSFDEARESLRTHGFWIMLVGGFTPIPFKLFTIAAGTVAMPLLPFLAAVLIGRGKRVYLVAGAIRLGGERAERALHRYIEPVGWAALVLLVVGVVALWLWKG